MDYDPELDKVFESVARHLSFSRAAEEMHLSQPAVSIQVKKLEDHAGLPLFVLVVVTLLVWSAWQVARAERIEGGKVIEWMSRRRGADGQWQLQYVHERGKRRLAIAVTDTTSVEGFDDAIWRKP